MGLQGFAIKFYDLTKVTQTSVCGVLNGCGDESCFVGSRSLTGDEGRSSYRLGMTRPACQEVIHQILGRCRMADPGSSFLLDRVHFGLSKAYTGRLKVPPDPHYSDTQNCKNTPTKTKQLDLPGPPPNLFCTL